MNRAFPSLAIVLALTALCDAREWTDKTGKFRVEAEFVSLEKSVVRLKKPSGEIVSVPLFKLSKESIEPRVHLIVGNKSEQPNPEWLSTAVESTDGEYALELMRAHPTFATHVNKVGWSPLFGAAQAGHKDAVAMLLSLKANPLAKHPDDFTPLHLACDCKNLACEGYPAVVKMLIEAKADVNARDERSFTPLIRAAAPATPAHLAVAKLLLENGANINARDENGGTALHRAIDNVTIIAVDEDAVNEMVKMLLAHKLDPKSVNTERATPLSLAEKKGYTKVAATLKAHLEGK